MTTRQAPRGGGWKGSQGKGGPGKSGFGKGGPGRRSGDEARNEREDVTVLYGWHPVSEALRNPKREFRRLLATENAAVRLAEEVGELRITPEIVKPGAITGLLGPDAVHQGLYLEAEPLETLLQRDPDPRAAEVAGRRIRVDLGREDDSRRQPARPADRHCA